MLNISQYMKNKHRISHSELNLRELLDIYFKLKEMHYAVKITKIHKDFDPSTWYGLSVKKHWWSRWIPLCHHDEAALWKINGLFEDEL